MSNVVNVDISQLGTDLMLANRLFVLGARTPVVCSLCGINRKTANRIYRIVHQKSPKKGMLPWHEYWVIDTSVNNLHASIFLGMIQDFLNTELAGIEYARQFICAYELYCRVVANNPEPSKREQAFAQFRLLDINRAWQITQKFKTQEYRLAICPACKARHVIVSKKDEFFDKCPACEIWTDITGRRRWISSTRQHNFK